MAEPAGGHELEAVSAAPAALSKRAQKRLAREAGADARHERVLQRRRAVRERQRLERAQARAVAPPGEASVKKRPKQVMLCDPRASAVRVALDLSFEHIMAENPKDVAKLAKQIERCYGDNRRAARPLQLHITSLEEEASAGPDSGGDAARSSSDRTASHLRARCGFSNWDVHRHGEHCFQVWPQAEIVYALPTPRNSNAEIPIIIL